ncbi:MAG: hypothetical protein MZV70_30655 [Desulfobacterales bacterium]|nr:hypothetical protein [Desulfobacterales bacterium]
MHRTGKYWAITADPSLDADATGQSSARTLAEQKYDHTETAVNRNTRRARFRTSTYATRGWKESVCECDYPRQPRVVQVTMAQETPGWMASPLVPSLLLAALILTMVGAYGHAGDAGGAGFRIQSRTALPSPRFLIAGWLRCGPPTMLNWHIISTAPPMHTVGRAPGPQGIPVA